MAEYIERDAILKKLDEREEFLRGWLSKFRSGSPDYNYFASRLNEFIEDSWTVRHAPAADVSPVVHGRWVNEDFPENLATVHDMAKCSVCGEFSHKSEHGYSILSKFCHNCGAKMDKEADNAQ